ncbi:hypothetical protein EDD22DRAFT_1016661, partial [Suillus occidentalis]
WKNLGLEYEKARMLALRRAYPDALLAPTRTTGKTWSGALEFPVSVQARPRLRISGLAPPDATFGNNPLVMKVRSRASSVMSGASTPGGGAFKSLSEHDLQKAMLRSARLQSRTTHYGPCFYIYVAFGATQSKESTAIGLYVKLLLVIYVMGTLYDARKLLDELSLVDHHGTHPFDTIGYRHSAQLTAFVVGFSILAAPVRTIGVTLIVFYFDRVQSTKYGKSRKLSLKMTIKTQATDLAPKFSPHTHSFTALHRASGIWCLAFAPDVLPWSLVKPYIHPGSALPPDSVPYGDGQWCPLDATVSSGLSRALTFCSACHFACFCGDTLASELGILSSRPPILITTLKLFHLVQRWSRLADLASFLRFVHGRNNEQLDDYSSSLVFWGSVAGAGGSLRNLIAGGKTVKVISGLNLLTNNQVNLLSSIGTALAVAKFASMSEA